METNEFMPRDGISNFVYHPWFEPIPQRDFNGSHEEGVKSAYAYPYRNFGPHWFGNGSTRGVLSDAVARMLEDNKLPGAEPQPMWWRVNARDYGDVEWNLADYLRTPVYQRERRPELEEDSFRVPTTYWELLHPELPILKITSHVATKLPLRVPGEEPGITYFAVSFVISFQNRWESFGDPNRWLIRFEEDLKEHDLTHQTFCQDQGAIDEEMHEERFPDYWHWSDYMQHQIIGPVVLQVYESDVIAPGVYSMMPKVSEWTAPGYVVPDDRQLMVRGFVIRHPEEGREIVPVVETFTGWEAVPVWGEPGEEGPEGGIITDGRLSLRAVPMSPNPGYPLPGHVMTNAYTAPGTEVWDRFRLDDNEW